MIARPCSPLVQEQWTSEDGRRSCRSRETTRHQCALQSDGQPLRL
ncbi:hypothetical protein GGR94_001895 [Sulfitobacter geojensis]|nr:hypothetical protein [Sulfitobacter geojensis]